MKKKVLFPILAVVLALSLALPMAAVVGAAPTTIDFDSGSAGASVEGLGTLDPNLEITSTGDALVIVEENNNTYLAYSGNATSQNDTPNGGLPGGFGFGDVDRDDELGFDVTFNGNTVSSFSIDMFDYGDWFNQMDNYTGTKTHTAKLVAYDDANAEIDSDTLTFTSTGGRSTGRTMTTLNSVDIVDKPLSSAGDALEALAGDPGLWSFSVSGTGIFKVAMEFEGNNSIDPGVAWDNIEFEIEPFTTNLCAGQDIDIGNVVVENDGTNLSVTYEITEPGWLFVETHLEVVTCEDDFPLAKSKKPKNPIPGQFTWSTDHSPPVETFTYTILLADIGEPGVGPTEQVFIAAHAAVVKITGDGIAEFWATNSTLPNQHQGWDTGGNPVAVAGDRSDPMAVTGQPDAYSSPYGIGFFSLGEGGDITVDFGYPIFNGDGDYDISVHEISGNRGLPTENADVYVIVDGVEYYAGSVSSSDQGNGIGTVSIPEEFAYVDAVKIVDTTDKSQHIPRYSGDGYDVDAVDAYYLVEQDETAWGAGDRFVEKGNWATHFTYEVQEELNLEGEWDVELWLNGVQYDRFIIITDHDGNVIEGDFGVSYPTPTGPIEGTVTGLDIFFTYDPIGVYWAEFTGTISPDGNSMSGTWVHYNSGIPGPYWGQTWTATRIP